MANSASGPAGSDSLRVGGIGPLVVCAAFLLPMLYCMLADKEMWPFSSFPMYSGHPVLKNLVVYRLQIESNDGSLRFWHPPTPFTYESRAFDFSISSFEKSPVSIKPDPRRPMINAREGNVNAAIGDALRVIAATEGAGDIRALHVVRRKIVTELDGSYRVDDERILSRTPSSLIEEGANK